MRYIYVFLMIIGLLASLLGMFFLVVALFDWKIGNAVNEGLRFLVTGMVLIALGDMGSKISNLRKDFDYFLAQQRRPPQRVLGPEPDDENEL